MFGRCYPSFVIPGRALARTRRLSCLSMGLGLSVIVFVGFDERVGGDEELSGNGDERHLGRFSQQPQGLISLFHLRMMAAGNESCHVERGANAGPTAGNHRPRWRIAGLADMRRQPGKACNGPAVDAADLGQIGHQDGGNARADPRDRGQDPEIRCQAGIVGDAARQLRLDLPALLGEARDGGTMAGESSGSSVCLSRLFSMAIISVS